MNNGFITLHRKFLNWYGIQSAKRVQLWIIMLLKANHKDNLFLFNGKPITVYRGQFITGRKILAHDCKMSESQVERLLTEFEQIGQIEQQKTNTNRLITIVKYNEYQNKDNGQDNGQDNGRTTDGQQKDTNNNVTMKQCNKKEVYNISNIIKENHFFGNTVFNETYNNYLTMRIKIKKPATEKAQELIIKKLIELSSNDVNIAIKILEQSILNSWQGVFALKQDKQNPGGGVWNSKL